jgi:hypothetical protein
MKRAIAMALIASTLLAGLANASAPTAKAKTEEGSGATPRSLEAPYLAVPVLRNGQMVNYLFVSVRIEIAAGVDLWRTRERAHFLRDALVRVSHTGDLADPEDINALDETRAIAAYRATAVQVLGADAVGAVTIVATYSSRGSGI